MVANWRAAGRLGGEALGRLREVLAGDEGEEAASPTSFPELHWMTAALFLAAGADAARQHLPLSDPARLAPLLAAPVVGAAHAARALSSAPGARQATRLLDGVAAGVAVAATARVAYNALARGRPAEPPAPRGLAAALVPLTFGATAVLGLLLDRVEERERRELRRLRRRASVVERLVPRRRARMDHIVLHI